MHQDVLKMHVARCPDLERYADGQAGEPKRISGKFRPYENGMVEIGRSDLGQKGIYLFESRKKNTSRTDRCKIILQS